MTVRRGNFAIFALLLALPVCAGAAGPLDYVNTLIGTDGGGRCFPAVGPPFAMTQWTPETRTEELPYHYRDKRILGFRGSHFPSGSCMADYGSVVIMPVSGALKVMPQERASSFRHEAEVPKPHYYAVTLDDYGIRVELTATERCGIFRITFPEGKDAYVIVDTRHRGGFVRLDPERREVVGANYKRFTGYFVVQFDAPFEAFGTWSGSEIRPGKAEERGEHVGAFVKLRPQGRPVIVKVGTSFISVDWARRNLEAEIPDFDFERVRAETRRKWERVLSKVEVEGTDDQKTMFYTALYHCYLLPRIFNEAEGKYRSPFDGEVHEGPYYEDFSLWDTYRNEHPLLVLLEPERDAEMIHALVRMFEEGGWMPKWPNPRYTNVMIGTHADSIIADAFVKGVRNFDAERAYEAMLKDAEQPGSQTLAGYYEGRRGIEFYKRLGYVPADRVGEATSRTLEFAYNDFCVAQMAKALGRMDDYRKYLRRSLNYRNVFDPEVGFARGRREDGSWMEEAFDPGVWYRWFTEANSWIYTWYVPHDVQGLINLMGGRRAFSAKLERFFSERHYDIGNEPSMQAPYMFDWSGEPWRTQFWVREIIERHFNAGPRGLPGNDDCGTMSAWLIFGMLGFYPTCPGRPTYEIGSPCLPKAVIHLPNGKDFVIVAHNVSKENRYIQRVALNGRPLTRTWLRHEEIVKGGVLEFWMGPEPNKDWGSAPEAAPPSISEGPPKFEFVKVSVEPKEVKAGREFKVSVALRNGGRGVGAQRVGLVVDGKEVVHKWAVLAPGEEGKVTFELTLYKPGRHTVEVGGRRLTVSVLPSPPRFEYLSLRVLRLSPERFRVVAKLRNAGGERGTERARLVVDGKVAAEKEVSLGPGEEGEASFEWEFEESGRHEVGIGLLRPVVVEVPGVLGLATGKPFWTEGLVLWLRFEEGKGSVAYDSSGAGNHGTVRNAQWVPGRFGRALRFDGRSSFVEVPDSPSLNPRKELTLEAWILPFSWDVGFNRRVMQKSGLQDDRQYRLTAEWGLFKFDIFEVGGVAASLPQPGRWHHVVGVYDGRKVQLWVDGKLAAEREAKGEIPVTTSPLFVGTKRAYAPRSDWFNGLIDEVRVYNRALSPEEIRKLSGALSPTEGWHRTEWRDLGGSAKVRALRALAYVPEGTSVKAVVEVSDDGRSVKARKEISLKSGDLEYPLDLPPARFVRVETRLETSRPGLTPLLSRYVVLADGRGVKWSTYSDWLRGEMSEGVVAGFIELPSPPEMQ